LWVILALSLLYLIYLGAHWLPLGWSDKELSASASRVWDVKQEMADGHGVPWWTPNFMSGSSYGLNHARGLYLVIWGTLANWFSLGAAGKLMCLLAMFGSAVAMFFCARRLLGHPWAAALAAAAYLLHPQQLTRAAGAEHITIALSFAFVPLLWWTFARALDSNRLRDILLCGLVAAGFAWADNKQALAHGVFLAGYLVYWLWQPARRAQWRMTARTCVLVGAAAGVIGAIVIIPGLTEQKLVKLFYNDPVAAWQKTYSFKSLLGLADRDGYLTRTALQGVQLALQTGRIQPQTQFEAEKLQKQIQLLYGLGTDAPEKYMGLVLLTALAVTALLNGRRQNRALFWTLTALLMATIPLSTAQTVVAAANIRSITAWFGVTGVPGAATLGGLVLLGVLAAFLVLFWKKKLTTPGRRLLAAGTLVGFGALPLFAIVSMLPMFGEIRAPYVFYDGPAMFLAALALGFFVTDVLDTDKWRAKLPAITGGVMLLLLADYWPYQKPAKDNGVPAHTLANLQNTYRALAGDKDMVKTYSVSGRYFHLLGPMYSGKPQVWEAFYNWMAPLGTGLLNQQAFSSLENHRAFLNLVGARYVVFDKTDPSNQGGGGAQMGQMYRQAYPVALENEDFAVFRNETARGYVTAYERACQFVGDVRQSAPLALALAGLDWPLVHGERPQPGQFERVYQSGMPAAPPSAKPARVELADLQITRERHGLVRIRATTPKPCLAVIAESWYPFWQANVDGKPTPVLRVSTGLMGIEVPAGQHEIVLHYEPPRSYAIAGTISLVSLLGVLGYVVTDAIRTGRRNTV